MKRTDFLEGDAVDPHRYGDKRIGFHFLKLTEKEREFLAPFIAAWHDADDAGREPGVRLEDPEGAEDEFNGLEDEPDVWWEGWDRVTHNRHGEIVEADGLLPSERLARKPVVRL